jgi:hypothetical protein
MVECSQNTTKILLLWVGGSHSSIQLHVLATIGHHQVLLFPVWGKATHICGVLVNSGEISFTWVYDVKHYSPRGVQITLCVVSTKWSGGIRYAGRVVGRLVSVPAIWVKWARCGLRWAAHGLDCSMVLGHFSTRPWELLRSNHPPHPIAGD